MPFLLTGFIHIALYKQATANFSNYNVSTKSDTKQVFIKIEHTTKAFNLLKDQHTFPLFLFFFCSQPHDARETVGEKHPSHSALEEARQGA